MIPLPYLSVARFHGADACEFLHAQLSADIAALEPGEATFACYCSPRGQVIGLLLVCRMDNEYLVTTSAELLPRILIRLKMYVLRSRVEFSARPGIGVYGIVPPEDISGPGLFTPGGTRLHYLLSETAGDTSGRAELFKTLEIRNHVSWLGPETAEKFTPQMLGFDQIGAVSFTKGCYPGQEIIARIRYLGKVKRKPLLVAVEEQLLARPAERLELRREGAWSDGTVIDCVPVDGSGTLCFIVAPVESGAGPDELRYQGRIYRCATT
jgi:folate-binding protein YgfZ